MGDVLITAGPDGADITNLDFDDIMDLLGENPDDDTMALTMKRRGREPRTRSPTYVVKSLAPFRFVHTYSRSTRKETHALTVPVHGVVIYHVYFNIFFI